MPDNSSFSGEIRVASRIVDYLSSGLYETPAAALKELINNSFDADATRVDVFIKPDADRIIIDDNGIGLNRAEFERHFGLISESHKRDESETSPQLGRPLIGKIGIGFIAANEICDVMEIVSTKKGSTQLLEVSINFEVMREEPSERRHEGDQFTKADYDGITSETDEASHFTQVFLKRIRGEARSLLAGAGTTAYASGKRSLYGLKPESILRVLKEPNFKSWSELDAYSKNRLEIGLNVPVRYHDGWMPQKTHEDVAAIEKHVSELDFAVFLDGSEIRKPIVFNPEGACFTSPFEFEGEHVAATGYFYVQHGTIRPQELQGLLIRVRNAAIGKYDPSFMGFSPSTGALFQNWISGEILAGDTLEDAMNIDRQTMRLAHPAYVELQKAVHEEVARLISRARNELYGRGRAERREQRVRDVKAKIAQLAETEIARVAPEAAEVVRDAWEDVTSEGPSERRILQKYTVDELYELIVEIAEEVLPREQYDKFVIRLTERLRR